jgi:hypothetical protein
MSLRGVNSSSGVPLGGTEQSKAPTESKTTFFGGLAKTVKNLGKAVKGLGSKAQETGAKLTSLARQLFSKTPTPEKMPPKPLGAAPKPSEFAATQREISTTGKAGSINLGKHKAVEDTPDTEGFTDVPLD